VGLLIANKWWCTGGDVQHVAPLAFVEEMCCSACCGLLTMRCTTFVYNNERNVKKEMPKTKRKTKIIIE
jgi:hypothetical protein